MKRFSVLSVMAMIALAGLGLAAMRDGSQMAENAAYCVLFLTVSVGLLGAIVRRGSAAWTGYALFSTLYALTLFVPDPSLSSGASRDIAVRHRFGLDVFLNALTDRLYAMPQGPPPLQAPFISTQDGQVHKIINQKYVPMTDFENAIALAWRSQWKHYTNRYYATSTRRLRAVEIGHVLIALLFGIVGSLVGCALVPRNASARESTSSDPLSSPEEPAR